MPAPVLVSLALLQAVGGASAAAPNPASGPPVAAAAVSPGGDTTAAADPDPMVCRRVAVSGSAFARKECHPLSVWTRMARDGN